MGCAGTTSDLMMNNYNPHKRAANQAVGGSTPSGRAIQCKQQVREDLEGFFYLLFLFLFLPSYHENKGL